MLSGTSAINSSGSVVNGSMTNNGRWPDADKVTFEQNKIWMYKTSGYTDGGLGATGSTFGTAAASSVLSGSTFTSSNGLKISGTMANRGSISATLNPGGSKSYSAGYYSGGTVSCNSATSAIKTTTLNITGTWNNNTASGSVSGTIIGIKSMWRNGNSNPPLSISTSGGTLSVEWNSYNGSLNLGFSVAYI